MTAAYVLLRVSAVAFQTSRDLATILICLGTLKMISDNYHVCCYCYEVEGASYDTENSSTRTEKKSLSP